MNLIKLFNKNYAIQNMKKSKGILAIMFIIIPIVTLFALYNYDNESYNQPYNIYVLANINIVGMFIIPFILSNVLLGYVYKKNSIDFINSMPISRKKIYLTNILIGIVYLILLQLANFIISAIYIGIIGNSLTSFQMILDLLLIMIVGYSFIYVISCLSLTISGNKFTQMVVLMVIIFFIPFIRFVNFSIISENDVNLIVANGYSEIYNATFNVPLFTIPIECFKALFINETIYNLKSTFITIILSLVYIIIGTKLFEKEKWKIQDIHLKVQKYI